MKIGLIGDTHGFDKPIDYAINKEKNIDLWIHTGDIVGGKIQYLTNPKGIDKSIKLLQEVDALAILGNHDQWALNNPSTYISEFAKEYLDSLTKEIILPELSHILFQHSMPTGEKQLFPTHNKFDMQIRALIESYPDTSILFHGHSHIASVTSKKNDNQRINFDLWPKFNKVYHLDKNSESVIDIGMAFHMTPARLLNHPRYATFDTTNNELRYKKIK